VSQVLRPLTPPRSLTDALVARIADEISSGRLRRGDRLPTEQELVSAAGVSRTVVREAVAALKALGLVETRQGVGAFVASEVRRRPFQIDPQQSRRLPDMLHVLELRLGIEMESAVLAAQRRTAAHLTRLSDALEAIGLAIARGNEAVGEDFAFHCAIADATGNPYFRQLLEALGIEAIPRQVLQHNHRLTRDRTHYLLASQEEHRALFGAIDAQDAKRARAVMRRHLHRGTERYRLAVIERDDAPAPDSSLDEEGNKKWVDRRLISG
jgi:GntR family transcriptional repressor for pyruvate dehydrogenase complex